MKTRGRAKAKVAAVPAVGRRKRAPSVDSDAIDESDKEAEVPASTSSTRAKKKPVVGTGVVVAIPRPEKKATPKAKGGSAMCGLL